MILDECRGNRAELIYNERYPNHPRKFRMAVCGLKNRFLQYACVRPKRHKQITIINEEKSANIIAYVTVDPYASSRLIATESGISQISVIRILHNYKFHPYHMSFYQNLYGNDFTNR